MAGAMVMQLRQGRQYSKDWPMIDEFNAIFRENLVIRMTQFAERLLPMAFAVIVGLYVWQGEAAQMHLLLAMAVVVVSMPLQGYLWLGKRAATPLPRTLRIWYQDISTKLKDAGVTVPQYMAQPTYHDLALLLKTAASQLDKTFLRAYL